MSTDDLFRRAVACHQRGQLGEAEQLYRSILAVQADHPQSLHYLGLTLLQRGQHQAAVSLIRQSLDRKETNPEGHYHLGLAYAGLGFMEEVERHNRRAVALNPGYADAYMNLGNALNALGRTGEAIESLERSRSLNPNRPEVHFNLANILFSRRELDAAIDGYQRALSLRPNYADALQNLAATLVLRGRIAEAEAAFRRVLELRPDFVGAMVGLALALLSSTKVREAVHWLSRAIEIEPTPQAREMFCECVPRLDTIPNIPALRGQLIAAITEPWVEPRRLAPFAIDLLKQQSPIASIMRDWDDHDAAGISEAHIAALGADPLFDALLENVPIPDLTIESILAGVRRYLLKMARTGVETDAMLALACALGRQCFMNEYVYACDEIEAADAHALRDKIDEVTTAGSAPSPLQIAVISTYLPLSELRSAVRLNELDWPRPVRELFDLQVGTAITENRLKAAIPRLTAIEDDVSRKVQQQYEENPYPRWTKWPGAPVTLSLENYLRMWLPLANLQFHGGSSRNIMVAGCGTGQQPISYAKLLNDCSILAVDLSLSSLAYAKRRAEELGVSNIEFAQADILQLSQIERSFDFIDSSGVLHHMADPFAGWRALIDLVRPGGFMRIGLYSKTARRGLRRFRDQIAKWSLPATPEGIRQARKRLAALDGASATDFPADFYTTSECRDLLFHVQEHELSLPQIAEFLQSTRLNFLGFVIDRSTLARYCAEFPDDRHASDLASWHLFEQSHPDTFVNMYPFVVQKPG